MIRKLDADRVGAVMFIGSLVLFGVVALLGGSMNLAGGIAAAWFIGIYLLANR